MTHFCTISQGKHCSICMGASDGQLSSSLIQCLERNKVGLETSMDWQHGYDSAIAIVKEFMGDASTRKDEGDCNLALRTSSAQSSDASDTDIQDKKNPASAASVSNCGFQSEIPVVEEIFPCPYVNGFAADNSGVSYILKCYDQYRDLVVFQDGAPARCFRFAAIKPVLKVDAAEALSKAILKAHAKWAATYQGVGHVD